MKKVLIIEDDPKIVELLDIHLKDLDCQIETAYEGHEGLRKALAGKFDLIILDIMIPGIDGMEVCRQIRAKEIHTPILMLTARSEEIDKVLGLEMGADDYLTKPFSIREFLARVKAIFRRMEMSQVPTQPQPVESILQYGDLLIDRDKRKVTIKNTRIELSPKNLSS
jgi:two-component system alkaline phosphatase synthesis response regulator PhoP